jgi:hypothetical protein
MVEYAGGRNNWYTVNWDDNVSTWKCNQGAKYINDNFYEECNKTLQLIVNDRPSLIPYVPLTGGMDSELVANCFLQSGIDFKIVMLDIAGYNQQEQQYAYQWCQKNNITPIIKTFTIDELVKISQKYIKDLIKSKNFLLSPIIWLMDWSAEQNGFVVFATGDVSYDLQRKEFFTGRMVDVVDHLRPGQHPSNFFMYTPELMASFVSQVDPLVDIRTNKFRFYQIPNRSKMDYTMPWSKDKEYHEKFLSKIHYITRAMSINKPIQWLGSKEQLLGQLLK